MKQIMMIYIYFNENISSINIYDNNWKKYNSPKIEVIDGKNKIKIKMLSISYHLNPHLYNYYIIINKLLSFDFKTFYSIITNKTKIDKFFNEFMAIIEDNGTKQTLEYEIDLDVELKRDNNFVLIPVGKENNLIELNYIVKETFYNNIKEEEENEEKEEPKKTSTVLIVVFSIIGAILIIIVVLIIYFKIYKKKYSKKSSEDPFYEPIIRDNKYELN